MRFEFFVASRYLRAKRKQAVIGVITGLSIAGVAAGVASLVVALAVNNGFRQDLQDRLLGSTSHINLLRTRDCGCPGHLRASADFGGVAGAGRGAEGDYSAR
jgi:lipoprotein-releasing system permease protein